MSGDVLAMQNTCSGGDGADVERMVPLENSQPMY